jgi:hypothetical protein
MTAHIRKIRRRRRVLRDHGQPRHLVASDSGLSQVFGVPIFEKLEATIISRSEIFGLLDVRASTFCCLRRQDQALVESFPRRPAAELRGRYAHCRINSHSAKSAAARCRQRAAALRKRDHITKWRALGGVAGGDPTRYGPQAAPCDRLALLIFRQTSEPLVQLTK